MKRLDKKVLNVLISFYSPITTTCCIYVANVAESLGRERVLLVPKYQESKNGPFGLLHAFKETLAIADVVHEKSFLLLKGVKLVELFLNHILNAPAVVIVENPYNAVPKPSDCVFLFTCWESPA